MDVTYVLYDIVHPYLFNDVRIKRQGFVDVGKFINCVAVILVDSKIPNFSLVSTTQV